MKIWEIDWTEGKRYKDKDRCIWKVENASLYHGINNIAEKYNLEYLIKLEFEPYIDWSKVEVDTHILVSEDGTYWFKRHFAKYEKDIIYVFSSGRTSWSIGSNDGRGITQCKYAKLAESEEN